MKLLELLTRLSRNSEAVIEYPVDETNLNAQCWIVNRAGIVSHARPVDRVFMEHKAAFVEVACQYPSKNRIWRPSLG
jgi:hypothetical protein